MKMDTNKAFEILGIEYTTDMTIIKKAGRRLFMKYHPDQTVGEENERLIAKFNEVMTAYEYILDLNKVK